MKSDSPMLLIGIGTAGCAIARGVGRAFGEDIRCVLVDTDATSGEAGGDFVLIGGDIRPRIIDALNYLVGRIKHECVVETERH